MRWICKYCNNVFEFDNPKSKGAHLTSCSKNPKCKEIRTKISNSLTKPKIQIYCKKCNKCFFTKNKKQKYCSRACSNKRKLSKETVDKLKERSNYKKANYKIVISRKQKEEIWKKEAVDFFKSNKSEILFLFGIGLYWGEGAKKGKSLCFCNSDPAICQYWISWHKKYLFNLTYKVRISAHEDVIENEAKEYWASKLNVDKDSIKLYRAIPKSSKGKRPRRRLPYGTVQIITRKGSVEWHTKMMRWIEVMSSNLLSFNDDEIINYYNEKNIETITIDTVKKCLDCKINICNRATRCKSCAAKTKNVEKILWPDDDTLLQMIKKTNFCAVGRKLGVSDNAIRKRLRRKGLM